jgi:hypothetical protein
LFLKNIGSGRMLGISFRIFGILFSAIDFLGFIEIQVLRDQNFTTIKSACFLFVICLFTRFFMLLAECHNWTLDFWFTFCIDLVVIELSMTDENNI